MTTLNERALAIANEDIIYFGDFKFKVASQSIDTVYNVNLESKKCTCPAAYQGRICKHILAARNWLETHVIYDRAKEVVDNNPEWRNGATRTICDSKGRRIYIEENHSLLWLVMVYRSKVVRTQCGILTYKDPFSPWSFVMTKSDYNGFKQRLGF